MFKARARALAEIGHIRQNLAFIDKRAFCILYNQRVHPHLDYGMAACPPNTSAESKLMETVKSKATALVQGMRGMNSEEQREQLGLMKLEDRRLRGDLIEVFKILKGLTDIDPAEFWEVPECEEWRQTHQGTGTQRDNPSSRTGSSKNGIFCR